MKTLLLAKHDNKRLFDATHKALTAARDLGGEIDVLVAGKDCRSVAEQATKLAGVAKVPLAEDASLSHRLPPDTFERPIYAGNAIQTVRSRDAKKVLTVRTATFQATGAGGSAPIETIKVPANPAISSFVGGELSKSDPPEF